MKNPTAAMLVIGDEVLSGRTRDANMYYLANRLTEHGIDLREVRIVTDNHDHIAAAVNELREQADYLFTSGGIGPTHDDVTADAVAAAFGVSIEVRDDARELIKKRCQEYGLELNAARLRMARIPDGADLILNAESAAPGFSLGNVYVMAGVPKIFVSMLDWLLAHLRGGSVLVSESVEIATIEGEVAAQLGKIAADFPEVQIGSYPFRREGHSGVNIVIRSRDREQLSITTDVVRKTFANVLKN